MANPDLDAKARLKPQVEKDREEDVDDDLKGYTLRALWPEQLSVRELLRSLTLPKNDSYLARTHSFLSNLKFPHFPRQMR